MSNILHLQTQINFTCGISRVIKQVHNNLKAVHNTFVVTTGGDAVISYRKEGVNINKISIPAKPYLLPLFVVYFYFFCKKNKIDIIHSHHRLFDTAAYFVSKLIRVRTITSVHSIVFGKNYFSYRAEELIAVSNSVKKHLIGEYNILPERISVINNFIDRMDYNLKSQSSQKNGFTFAFIGRFSKEKGVDLLIEAFGKLKENNVNLIMTGTGEKIKLVKKLSAVFPNIKIKPPVKDISAIYANSDVIVLPSRVDPYPLVMLEAALFKKPVIAADVNGIAEFIENGINGILFEKENITGLRESLQIMLNDSGLRYTLAENNFNKVVNNNMPEHIIPKYNELYGKFS